MMMCLNSDVLLQRERISGQFKRVSNSSADTRETVSWSNPEGERGSALQMKWVPFAAVGCVGLKCLSSLRRNPSCVRPSVSCNSVVMMLKWFLDTACYGCCPQELLPASCCCFAAGLLPSSVGQLARRQQRPLLLLLLLLVLLLPEVMHGLNVLIQSRHEA